MARTLFDRPNGFLPVETLIEGVALKIIAAGEPEEFGLHGRQQFHDIGAVAVLAILVSGREERDILQPQRSRGRRGEFEDVFLGGGNVLGLQFGLEFLPFGSQTGDFGAGEGGLAIGAFKADGHRAGETGGGLRKE